MKSIRKHQISHDGRLGINCWIVIVSLSIGEGRFEVAGVFEDVRNAGQRRWLGSVKYRIMYTLGMSLKTR